MKVTPADEKWITWLARWRFANADQLARKFETTAFWVYDRMRFLRTERLIAFERPLLEKGGYRVTPQGVRLVGLDLPAGPVDSRTFRHDRLVLDQAISLEAQGLKVWSEKEMRHEEGFDGVGRFAFKMVSNKAGGGRHFPDLAVETVEGLTAYEIEIYPKRTERLKAILRDFRWAKQYREVVYLVDKESGNLAERIAGLVKELQLSDKIEVYAVDFQGGEKTCLTKGRI